MQAWLHVRNNGDGVPVITRAYPDTIQVQQEQPGVYRVFLPLYFQNVVAVGSIASSVGMITVIPGDQQGGPANEVSVFVLGADGNFASAVDFSLWAASAASLLPEEPPVDPEEPKDYEEPNQFIAPPSDNG